MKMLSKPSAGWTDFSIGDNSYQIGYMSDVPTEWLQHAIFGLETNSQFVVYGNCEPGEIYCIVDYNACMVVWDDCVEDCIEEKFYVTKSFGKKKFCQELYKCIKEDIDDWACWPSAGQASYPLDAWEVQNKQHLQELLEKLKGLLGQMK